MSMSDEERRVAIQLSIAIMRELWGMYERYKERAMQLGATKEQLDEAEKAFAMNYEDPLKEVSIWKL